MNDIYYLVHTTNTYNTNWTELKTSSIDNWDDQFPGVFLSLITKNNIDIEQLYSSKYILIFSCELLKQKNYHINIKDYNGYISEKNTYYPWNLTSAIKKIKQNKIVDSNEVIFHDPIDMKYLCEVIEIPSTNIEKINSYLPRYQIKNEVEPDMTKEPFYCYPLENNYSGANPLPSSSARFFKKMAKVCGVIDKENIIEEIKLKIPYLYTHRLEQKIHVLQKYTRQSRKSRKSRKRTRQTTRKRTRQTTRQTTSLSEREMESQSK
jgi:hypothetical protein